jgi:CheY-like chemotaxis protein
VRIRQILSNLVSNAIKFTEDGEVLVTVSAPTDAEGRQWMRFEISDTGIGIAPQMQSMVFDAFAQVDDSSTRRFGGTGLGLTICRELVGLMGGSIGLNSEPGVGSCFHFQIPVESLGDSAMPEPQPAPAGHESLIVSPNRLIRAALVQSLQPSGSPPCLTANSLAEATQALERLPAKIRSVDIYLDACPRLAVTPDALAELRLAAQGRELRCTLLAPPAGNSNNELAVDQVIFKPICTVALAMRDRQSAAAAPAPVHAANLSAASGRKVLLVEDNAINQEIAVAMLDKLGIACLVAENGAEALELLAATPDIGLILMDCQMPIMDGFATTRAIRQGKVASQVPVIALTGNAMQGDKEACLAAGMNDYLTKPFGLAALQDKLQRWLKPEEAGLLARHPLAHQVT